MDQVKSKTKDLLLAVLESEVYLRFKDARNQMKKYPILKEKADEFRKRNYELQSNGTEHFDGGDKLQAEYAHMMENSVVWEYLEAEGAVCRMLRQISWDILGELDIELDFEPN